jgi:hypothetical protein
MDMKSITYVAKKNWVSILCGVLALVGVIATLTVIVSQKAAVQKALDARKTTHESLVAALAKPRHQPVVSLDPDAPPQDLTRFPNRLVIDAGVQAIKRVADQSMQLKSLATSMNQKDLLVPGSLPAPVDSFKFQQTYLQQFDTAIPRALNSVTPPTEPEIEAEKGRRAEQLQKEALHNPATGEVYNKEVLDQKIATMAAQLGEQMRQEAATKHKMYMSPTALTVQPEMAAGNGATVAPSPETIWLAQMGLWIQDDVVQSIAQLNHASTDVDGSTVKELTSIIVPTTKEELYVLPGTASATPAQAGAAVSSVAANTETDPLPKDYSVSPTGRICNGVFDVVHFTVVLNVRAADVEKVIQQLEQDRLLTVYHTQVDAVNSAAMQQDGFYFGKSPVVTLTLKCEELFIRDWTRKLMPATVKTYLNVQEPGAAPPAAQPEASTN